MPSVTIDSKEYAATPLTPAQRNMWQVFLGKVHRKLYWEDLREAIATLPFEVHSAIYARSSPPRTLDRLRYFEVASQVSSVEYLVNMTLRAGAPKVTESNAAEIFMALVPLILDRPVTLSGGEALAKLKEGDDAGRDG